jgi:DNA-binding NarL/FixJ family response regulator
MSMDDRDRVGVFLVEDEDLVRAGARHYLEPEFEIVGESDNVTDSVEMIREREPDLVLLDVRIKEGNGAQVVEEVRETHPDVKFLALTVSTSREDVLRLFRAGVDGYITKFAAGPDLPNLVSQALEGGRPISRQVAGYLLDIDEDIPAASGLERLTPREREVVVLVARGYTYNEIAADLGISVKTLETHISHIFKKLEVASRNEVTWLAIEHGFVTPES